MSDLSTQKRYIRLNYPACPICGLRVPPYAEARMRAHGCCDFCRGTVADPVYRDRWHSDHAGGSDAVAYERGPFDQ